MDNSNEHMDEIFKSRFEGLKDHSVNPSSQWAAVEQALSAPVATATASAASGASAGVSSFAMAASVVGLIGVAGFIQGDSEGIKQSGNAIVIALPTDESKDDSSPSDVIEWASATGNEDPVIATEGESSASAVSSNQSQELLANTSSIPSSRGFRATNGSGSNIPPASVVRSSASSASQSSTLAFNPIAPESSTALFEERADLEQMSALSLSLSEPSGLLTRDVPKFEAHRPTIKSRAVFAQGRAGLRIGTGENNTSFKNEVLVNGYASVGVGYQINEIVSVVSEIGLMRRSGNNIERLYNRDVSDIFGIVGNTYSIDPNQIPEEINVQQSLISTRSDWLQLPVSVRVKTTDRSLAYIGGYAEYMIAVKNESYLIYNDSEYVAASLTDFDSDPFVGLNRLRFGALIGGSYQINDHLFADARVLIAMNSAAHDDGYFKVVENPNRGVDLQVGITYQL